MVVIIVESLVPHGKSSEAGKKWLEVVKKFPPDRSISKQVMVCVRSTLKGMEVIGVWDVKDGKEKEALIRMSESMLMFTEVEGYKYSIKTYLSAVEAMGLLGMEPPEA